MALTPDDIVNYEFKQAMRGYAVPQVDDLLDRLADQVERQEREIDDLRQRLRETEARLASTFETESTLKRTLVTAQEAAERALEDARQQADELRGAAEREVTEQLETARHEADELGQRARAEAEQLTGQARAEAEELTGRARAEAEELTARAHREAEEVTARVHADADQVTANAQQEADDLVAQARAEADQVTSQAYAQGEELTMRAQEAARAELQDAREERAALEDRLDELREMEHRHRAVIRRHLESHLAVLDDLDELPPHRDPDHDVEAVAPAASPSLQIRVRDEEAEGADAPDGDEAAFAAPAPHEDQMTHPVGGPTAGADEAGYGAWPSAEVDEVHRFGGDDGRDHDGDQDHAGQGHDIGVHEDVDGADHRLESFDVPASDGSDGFASAGTTDEDAGGAGAEVSAQSEHEGLFDHDETDMAEEMAVPSPWEAASGSMGDHEGRDGTADDDPSHEAPPEVGMPSPWQPAPSSEDAPPSDEAPLPWEPQSPSFPPPAAHEREDADPEAGDDGSLHEPAPQPHVRPHPEPADRSEGQEPDPYEHYDRFRDDGPHGS